jgi:hypothetical protein
MIVVVGSRHDAVALALVSRWPGAALCSAEDLVQPGWVWPHREPVSRTWLVDGRLVRDEEVTGVFTRRSAVYAEEFATIHPEDRAFLAAENHAFLAFVLATTSARVVNPVIEGAFGEEALRPERWTTVAQALEIPVRPVRVSSQPRRQTRYRAYEIEVVGNEVFGAGPPPVLEAAHRLIDALGVAWGVVLFDARHRLITITSARRPSDSAATALGRLLGAPRS